MEFKEIQAKTILTKCAIPGIDYVINPYIGCRFACKYCYASFMGRFVNKDINEWGEYVYAKVNAPQLLKKEVVKLKNKGAGKEIFFSSVTDPYQGVEAKYKLTRQCLQILADYGFKGVASILTKSDLVTRDIDIFKQLRNVTVGLTVTSTDDSISRYFEKFAPAVSKRLQALKILNRNGIKAYAFIGPLLPHFVTNSQKLEKLFQNLSQTGTRDMFIEHLNLAPYIRKRLLTEMKGTDQKILDKFYVSQSKTYRQELESMIQSLIKKYKMHMLLDMVIFHKEFQTGPVKRENSARIMKN